VDRGSVRRDEDVRGRRECKRVRGLADARAAAAPARGTRAREHAREAPPWRRDGRRAWAGRAPAAPFVDHAVAVVVAGVAADLCRGAARPERATSDSRLDPGGSAAARIRARDAGPEATSEPV